ncbi:MAG: phosphate/phosphite/phosphonate ABC transporter substrate-binding protein [Anaerolineae bacterium]|nr:phosphate/phosphite/phosphonate ABC transporter substrate-binding protein [Anaerolineae bacterium]
MKAFRTIVLLAVAAALLIGGSNRPVAAQEDRAGWPSNFIVGIFAGEDPGKALSGFEPERAYLEEKLGIRTIMYTGGSYTAVITAMKAGRVDGFEVGPFSYLLAAQEANAEALAVQAAGTTKSGALVNPDIKPYYYSVIVTKKKSGIKTLADLKGKSFSFVDPASTSGNLMPRTLIIKETGLDPDKDMKTIFAGSHPTSVTAIWSDKVDAGATYIGNLVTMANEGQVDLCWFSDGVIDEKRSADDLATLYDTCKDDQLVVIAMTDPIPNTPFAVNKNLPESFKKAVKDALLAIKDDPELVAKLGNWYVDPAATDTSLKATDNFYDGLRDVAKTLGLELKSLVK